MINDIIKTLRYIFSILSNQSNNYEIRWCVLDKNKDFINTMVIKKI